MILAQVTGLDTLISMPSQIVLSAPYLLIFHIIVPIITTVITPSIIVNIFIIDISSDLWRSIPLTFKDRFDANVSSPTLIVLSLASPTIIAEPE